MRQKERESKRRKMKEEKEGGAEKKWKRKMAT
jgi:hypothetical protein